MSEDNVLRHEIASLDKDLLVASKEIATLQSQLAASQKRIRVLETLLTADVHAENVAISDELELALERERILREGLMGIESLETTDHTKGACTYVPVELSELEIGVEMGHEAAAEIATATLKAAGEVKC